MRLFGEHLSWTKRGMIDLFESQEVTITELLRRIEALEAIVFKNAPPEPAKRLQVPSELKLAWARWDAHRKTQKGWTAEAKTLNLNKLIALSGSDDVLAQAIVSQSIEATYRGLFPLKGDKPAPSVVQTKTKTEALTPCETPEQAQAAWLLRQKELGISDER